MSDSMLYTPEEAARQLRVGRSRFYELMAAGEVASIKVGSSRRVTPEALHAFIERQQAAQRDADASAAS